MHQNSIIQYLNSSDKDFKTAIIVYYEDIKYILEQIYEYIIFR